MALGDLVAEVVTELAIRCVFYFTGKILIVALSLGQLRTDRLVSGQTISFPAFGGYLGESNGRRIVSVEGQTMLGVAFYIGLMIWLVASFS